MTASPLRVTMFSSWQVPCGIANYTAHLVDALQARADTQVSIVPFDRQAHPKADYVRWGQHMNDGNVAHVQHEYAFFGYLLPWRNYFPAFSAQINRPLVITKHVSFDGPLMLMERGPRAWVRQFKWALYNRWLGPYATYLNKGMFEVASHITVLSSRLKDELVARGLPANRITVIPPGVPPLPPAGGGQALRTQWGWSHKCVVGLFGFITPAKGHALALEALVQLPDDYVLLIAGGARRKSDHATLDALRQRIIDLNLQPRVRITGYLEAEAVSAHLNACNLLVYPYTRVDYSYSVIVGLAHQTAPVILSDVSGHRELAEQCQGVLLFQNGDATDLARQIQSVMGDANYRASLLQHITSFVRANAWSRVAEKTREVYAQVLEQWQAHA